MSGNMPESDKDKVAEDLTCPLIQTLCVFGVLVSIGVGFISGPGAGFLTMGVFVAIFAIALVYSAKLKMKEGK